MKKILIAVSLMLLICALPATALAETPTYYCSFDAESDGDGSYDYPWHCSDDGDLDEIVSEICGVDDYAILYQIVDDGYYYHVIEDPDDSACGITSTIFYAGYPPDTGIALPAPLMVGGLALLGAAFLGGGYFLYRKRYA